ncbi:MAG TPA: thioredoxin family protein [Pseudonocardiaceae bacterium]
MNPCPPRRFSVQAVPTLLVLHHSRVLARQPGAAPVDALRRWVDEAIARTSPTPEPPREASHDTADQAAG